MSTKWNFEFRPLYRAGSPQLSPIGGDDSPKRGAYIIAVVVYATLCVLAKQLCICVQLRMSSRLLGVAGNVVSFVVLKRAFGVQSPMFHVLRAMSVSDSVFLLAVFTVQSAVNAYQHVENYRGYVQYGVWPLLMTTQVMFSDAVRRRSCYKLFSELKSGLAVLIMFHHC